MNVTVKHKGPIVVVSTRVISSNKVKAFFAAAKERIAELCYYFKNNKVIRAKVLIGLGVVAILGLVLSWMTLAASIPVLVTVVKR